MDKITVSPLSFLALGRCLEPALVAPACEAGETHSGNTMGSESSICHGPKRESLNLFKLLIFYCLLKTAILTTQK